MSDLLSVPGAVEVIVLAEEGVTLNDPEHRSLGHIAMGERAVTHESYVPHLREQGLACPASELKSLDMGNMAADLAALSAQLQGAGEDDGDGEVEDDSETTDSTSATPSQKPKGRPRNTR